jgi:hypothetical protein
MRFSFFDYFERLLIVDCETDLLLLLAKRFLHGSSSGLSTTSGFCLTVLNGDHLLDSSDFALGLLTEGSTFG